MNQYLVQKNDTIAAITKKLQTDWQTIKSQNPKAVGKSGKNGNWFVREGATVQVRQSSFANELEKAKNLMSHEKTVNKNEKAELVEYTVKAGDTLWGLAINKYHVNLRDLVQDNEIENPDLIDVGQKLKIRKLEPGAKSTVVASWYGQDFQGKPMANGSPYNMYANTIAHKDLPLGTKVELANPRTGQTIKAVVTDRGPYVAGRDVDLSYGLAQKLSMVEDGVDTLVMRIL